MKKIILTLAIAVASLSSFANEVSVNSRVLNSFTSDFTNATQVSWSAGTNYYKASFVVNNAHVTAFYSHQGELMGTARNMSSLDLPIALQANLKKSYGNLWIADLFEVSNANGISYYITLENADVKTVLESSNGSQWNVYQRSTKL